MARGLPLGKKRHGAHWYLPMADARVMSLRSLRLCVRFSSHPSKRLTMRVIPSFKLVTLKLMSKPIRLSIKRR